MTGITDLDVTNLDWPYFVYGTLRPRCGNSTWWRECGGVPLFDGDAVAYGFKLIARAIPYAVMTGYDEDRVVGTLILPPDDLEDQVTIRFGLDRLEGHPHHYERIEADIVTPLGECVAWIYSPTKHKPSGTWVRSGDYYDFMEVNHR